MDIKLMNDLLMTYSRACRPVALLKDSCVQWKDQITWGHLCIITPLPSRTHMCNRLVDSNHKFYIRRQSFTYPVFYNYIYWLLVVFKETLHVGSFGLDIYPHEVFDNCVSMFCFPCSLYPLMCQQSVQINMMKTC